MKVRALTLFVLGLFTTSTVWAATPYRKTLSVKKNAYIADGVFTGGVSGKGASILGVRRTHSKKAQIERVIVDVADVQSKSKMPFFQASVDVRSKRITLDLAQLQFSKVSETALKNLFHKSPYVSDVALTLDPEDKGGTMVLYLKRPVRLEVFQIIDKKKPARVVMDLIPLKSRG